MMTAKEKAILRHLVIAEVLFAKLVPMSRFVITAIDKTYPTVKSVGAGDLHAAEIEWRAVHKAAIDEALTLYEVATHITQQPAFA